MPGIPVFHRRATSNRAHFRTRSCGLTGQADLSDLTGPSGLSPPAVVPWRMQEPFKRHIPD